MEFDGVTVVLAVGAPDTPAIRKFGVSVPDHVPLTMMPTVELFCALTEAHCVLAVKVNRFGCCAQAVAVARTTKADTIHFMVHGSFFSSFR